MNLPPGATLNSPLKLSTGLSNIPMGATLNQSNSLDPATILGGIGQKPQAVIPATVQQTAQDYSKAVPNFLNEAGRQDASTNANPVIRTGENALAATASGIGTVFAPVTNAVKNLSDSFANSDAGKAVYSNPVVSKILDLFGGASGALDKFAQAHPEAARNLSNLLTVGLTAAGGETKAAGKPIGSVEGIKTGASKAITGAKELVKGTPEANAIKVQAKNIQAVAPKLTPTEMNDALTSGQVINKISAITKKVEPDFSNYKTPQGTPLSDIANATKDYTTEKTATGNLNNIKQGIENISTKVVSPFLAENKVPFNYGDFIKKMELTKPPSSLNNPVAVETFSRVQNEVINSVANSLKKISSDKGNFGNTTDFNDVWNARKILDQKAQSELSNFSFGSPEYNGVKGAIQTLRTGFKQFIDDSLQFPGQMEQVNKMQDFLQEYRNRGAEIPNEKSAIMELQKQFGIQNAPTDVARAAFFRDQMNKLNLMYQAVDNLAPRARGEIGTTAWSRYIKTHPTIKAIGHALKLGGVIKGAESF